MRALVLFTAVAGCFDPDYSGFLCQESGCPKGYDCVGGQCVERGNEPTLPEIEILEPADGDMLDATLEFELSVDIRNFDINPDHGSDSVPGEGHWHWFIDGVYQAGVDPETITVGPLDAGCRILRAELRENNHDALDPVVFNEVEVYSTDGLPTICIVSPDAGETVPSEFELSVDIRDFVLDNSPAEGHGHWHLWVDDSMIDAHFLEESETITVVGAGAHEIMAELVRSDESALGLDPPRTATVTITVQ